MQLYVKMPTRSRPHKALPLLEKYILSAHEPYRLVACLQSDDPSMGTEEVGKELVRLWHLAKDRGIWFESFVHHGKTKIAAYNAEPEPLSEHDRSLLREVYGENELCPPPAWDIQVATSDDMMPLVDGWDVKIKEAMREHFPDTDGVLHFDDGHRHRELMTLPIVGRKWYDTFGYIYHPEYESVYCDNEMQEVAKLLRKYAYIDECIIEHQHPLFMKEKYDEQMRYTESSAVYNRDAARFRRRKAKRFGLVAVTGGGWRVPNRVKEHGRKPRQ